VLLPQPQKRRLQRVTLQPQQVETALKINQAIALTPEQRHYLCNVLRLETNSEFIALDRQGGWWLAQLTDQLDHAEIIAQLENHSELSVPITLSIAMPKGNNMESIVRQTTELGVRQIAPLFSDRTVIKAGTDVGQQKRDRWQRIAEEAAELSLRSYVPKIMIPMSFEQWLAQITAISQESARYICVTHNDAPHLWTALSKNYGEASQIAIATGCEGGWTEREEAKAIAAGFAPVSLGDRVLSAVTAPVVALSIVGAFLDTNR
jgi:16S rRNA (uracil1498-N3)-methyltransferase